jgi:hypothetical protein
MRLQLNYVKECTKELTQKEIIDLVLKMQESGLLRGDKIDVSPISESKANKIVAALNKLEGISASRQTLSYAYGMGGMYGHGIQVDFEYEYLKPVLWTGTDKDDGYTLNTVLFLEQFTKCERTNELLDENGIDEIIDYLEAVNDKLDYSEDNTYNHASDFSQEMVFYSPGIEAFEKFDTCVVLVALHYGGDVRGNYGGYTAYRMDYEDYCQFLEMHFGFYNKKYDRYTTGYTSEPQYAFFKDFEIVERIDNQTIKAKNIKTGEIVEFFTDIRI